MKGQAALGVWVTSLNPKDRSVFLFYGGFQTPAEAEYARGRAEASYGDARIIPRDTADFRARTEIPRDEMEGMPEVVVSHLPITEWHSLFGDATRLTGREDL